MAKKKIEETAKLEEQAVEEKKEIPQVKGELKRIKVNLEELAKLEAEGKLVGYDKAKGEALIY